MATKFPSHLRQQKTKQNQTKWIKMYVRMVCKIMCISQWRGGIPERWAANRMSSLRVPAFCPESLPATVQGGETQVELGVIHELWRWGWGSAENKEVLFWGQDLKKERASQKETFAGGPLWYWTEYCSSHVCDKAAQCRERTVQKHLEEATLS